MFPQFEKYYSVQFSGRNLNWLHQLSQAEVKMTTPSRSYFVRNQLPAVWTSCVAGCSNGAFFTWIFSGAAVFLSISCLSRDSSV